MSHFIHRTCFLGIIRILVLSCYFQEKQRSFTSGDLWVLPRWQVTHFQFLSVFQDGGHVKFPTLGQRLKINVKIPTQGKARSVHFPWVARHPPPWGLTLIKYDISCKAPYLPPPPPPQKKKEKKIVHGHGSQFPSGGL